jgi:aldehyde dehydrogenase (NAD+)
MKPTRKAVAPGRLLIGGTWRDAADGATMTTVDPTTEAEITTIARASAADADSAVAAATRAFEDGPWRRMHHEERAKILLRMADLMDARAEDFALREAMDMGMPYRDFREVIMPHCSGLFRFFAGQAMAQMDGAYRRSYEDEIRILTRREPLGVVAAITPFNFPLALAASKIAPALAAGNCVIHKPASDTPLTALALAQVALDAGVPEGVYGLLTGPGGSLGDALVKDPRIDKVAFTGSTGVGQGIARTGAATMKHLTMELGGKSPNIVFADANLDAALQAAFWGIFWNKGEVCVAGSRILVQRPIYEEFTAPRGDGTSRGGGRSTRPRHADRPDRVTRRVRQGAALHRGRARERRAACGRRRHPHAGRQGPVRGSDRLRPCDQRHGDLARGDLRPGRARDPLRYGGGSRAGGQ